MMINSCYKRKLKSNKIVERTVQRDNTDFQAEGRELEAQFFCGLKKRTS